MYKYSSFFLHFVLLHDKMYFMANQTYILRPAIICTEIMYGKEIDNEYMTLCQAKRGWKFF